MILLELDLCEYKYTLNLELSQFFSNPIGRCRSETFVHRTHACPITALNKDGHMHGPTTILADESGQINT